MLVNNTTFSGSQSVLETVIGKEFGLNVANYKDLSLKDIRNLQNMRTGEIETLHAYKVLEAINSQMLPQGIQRFSKHLSQDELVKKINESGQPDINRETVDHALKVAIIWSRRIIASIPDVYEELRDFEEATGLRKTPINKLGKEATLPKVPEQGKS